MRHLDLSYEGRQLAERNQLNNGKLPHGGHRGTRRFPPCHLSYDKGREFQHKVQEEIDRLLEDNEIALKGSSPSWAVLVSREPSYTDESPLITNSFMAASKFAPSNGVNLHNRFSLLPSKKSARPPKKRRDPQYYRPNSTHQYLSATELKNCSEEEVNLQHGRPTRTTLLRARQRCNSAPMNSYDKKRETDQRFEDFKTTHSVSSNTEYLQLDKDGETLHSFLTGARYNRAHCLDSRSVDHTGVYMPRHNPAFGCFFTGPKGHEYLKEFADSPRSDAPTPPSPPRLRRRPTTAPSQGRRPVTQQQQQRQLHQHAPARSAWTELSSPSGAHRPRHKQPRLNIVGCRLPVAGLTRDNMALKLPLLQGRALISPRGRSVTMDETYRAFQPPPTPTSIPQPSPGKPEPELIGNFRHGDELPVSQPAATTSVNVPTVGEVDENAISTTVTGDEAAFAAATVAAAIAAAVKEVSMSMSRPKEDEKAPNGTEQQKAIKEIPEEDTNHDNTNNTDDKPGHDRALDEDHGDVRSEKPATKGVRFFITEKTPDKKEGDQEKLVEEEGGGGEETSEFDVENGDETNDADGEYEKRLEEEDFEDNEEENTGMKEEEELVPETLGTLETLETERAEDASHAGEGEEAVDVDLLENEETGSARGQQDASEEDAELISKPSEPDTAPEIEITDVDGERKESD